MDEILSKLTQIKVSDDDNVDSIIINGLNSMGLDDDEKLVRFGEDIKKYILDNNIQSTLLVAQYEERRDSIILYYGVGNIKTDEIEAIRFDVKREIFEERYRHLLDLENWDSETIKQLLNDDVKFADYTSSFSEESLT